MFCFLKMFLTYDFFVLIRNTVGNEMEGFRTNRIETLFGFSLELGTLSNKLQKKCQKKNEGNHIP